MRKKSEVEGEYTEVYIRYIVLAEASQQPAPQHALLEVIQRYISHSRSSFLILYLSVSLQCQ